ncbi:hypothetical protein J3B02_006116 [Coemansia erecta]|nr:hypothetical protein J3B02_006116 [Coemansia erecta]
MITSESPDAPDQNQLEAAPSSPTPVIDPNLVSALSKHQHNRDFIIQAEHQTREFLKQTQHRRLLFPKQKNSFKRLLLHKLADYYSLTHVVVGRDKDEIAFYKKDQEEEGSGDLVGWLGDLVAFEPECSEDGESGCAAGGFTRILVKERRQHGASEGLERADLKKAANGGGCAVSSIEQRQAEYERTRAEIFQDSSLLKNAAPADPSGASICLEQDPLNKQKDMT